MHAHISKNPKNPKKKPKESQRKVLLIGDYNCSTKRTVGTFKSHKSINSNNYMMFLGQISLQPAHANWEHLGTSDHIQFDLI